MKIAFYHGTGPLDSTISFLSRGYYSHVCIVLNDGSIIEAYPFSGVRRRTSIQDKMKRKIVDVFGVPTTPLQDKIIEDFLIKQIGKGYDYWALFGFVLYTTEDSRKASGRWICSELVFSTFRKAEINLLERVEPYKISPVILSYSNVIKPTGQQIIIS
jgi:uncharacterized protein YycO